MTQPNLISWDDFLRRKRPELERWKLTAVACPVCGRGLYMDAMVELASLPPKHTYMCKHCNWRGVG